MHNYKSFYLSFHVYRMTQVTSQQTHIKVANVVNFFDSVFFYPAFIWPLSLYKVYAAWKVFSWRIQ